MKKLLCIAITILIPACGKPTIKKEDYPPLTTIMPSIRQIENEEFTVTGVRVTDKKEVFCVAKNNKTGVQESVIINEYNSNSPEIRLNDILVITGTERNSQEKLSVVTCKNWSLKSPFEKNEKDDKYIPKK